MLKQPCRENRLLLVALLLVAMSGPQAFAQATAEGGDASGLSKVPGEMDGIEEIFAVDSKGDSVSEKGPVIDDGESRKVEAERAKSLEGEFKGVSDLANLAPFKDVAILEKRFLPKTKRFELFGGVGGILNDKFFVGLGATGRLNYSFNERYAIELIGMVIATGEKSVTRDLREKRGVLTTNFVSPQSFYGADFKWTPLYGKMTFLNRKITPFDLYFSGGGGITNTNQGGSEPTIHFGTGQLFALSKSAAVRWDFSWNFYNAKSGVAGAQQNATYNNLFLTVGASFFFPEATYR